MGEERWKVGEVGSGREVVSWVRGEGNEGMMEKGKLKSKDGKRKGKVARGYENERKRGNRKKKVGNRGRNIRGEKEIGC